MFQHNQMATQAGDSFILESLYYLPMGEHTPVYNRPYMVNSDADAINTLVDRKMEKGASVIDGTVIGDLTTRFISPSANVEVSIIDQNWVTEPKFIFILKVRATDAVGNEVISYIQGYTNYNGITPQGNADLKLVHYINTVIETYMVEIPSPMGKIRTEKLSAIYNVFSPTSSEYFTQRPSDVMENMSLVNFENTFADSNVQIETQVLGGLVSSFNRNLVTSSVSNHVPTEYLSTILNASMHDITSRDIMLNSYEMKDNSIRGQKIVEPSISDNRFIKYLSAAAGFISIREAFEFEQLMMIDPTIHDRFTLVQLNKDYVDPMMARTPTMGEYWHGTDPVTLKAYSLIESCVALATKSGFNKLFFTATNMANPTGTFDIMITNFNSFTSLGERDLSYLLEYFRNKIELDVLIPETNGGRLPIFMEMYVDLVGTSKINLEYAGYPQTWYTIPTSANSLFSPVMTFDKDSLDAVSVGFHEVTNSLVEEETSRSRVYY